MSPLDVILWALTGTGVVVLGLVVLAVAAGAVRAWKNLNNLPGGDK